MTELIQEYRETLVLLSIPVMCGFVGWMTNVVALKMTFYPLKFWGIPPFLGWQGIIPRKAPKMAGKATEMLTERLISMEKMVDNVEARIMSREMSPVMEEMAEEIIEKVGEETNGGLWKTIPNLLKRQMVGQVMNGMRPVIDKITDDIKLKVLKAFDVKSHVVKNLTGHNVKLLVEIFQSVGEPEFKFIERCGWYFGTALGVVQAAIWAFYSEKWTLPAIGVVVGYVTNWLAITMIFRPLREKSYLGYKYQGLFLRRQDEVSKGYSNMIATRILSPRKILDTILFGKDSDRTFSLVEENVRESIDKMDSVTSPFGNLLIGRDRYDRIKEYAVERVHQSVPKSMRRVEGYLGQAMDLETTLYERMRELSPEEFEDVLRTAFKEDEIILILVGAFLGFLVGLFQALVIV